jgi:glucose 1-dehydrogenase
MLALMAASELAWRGVRVNLVEPGWTDTPGERTWLSEEALRAAGRELPLGRLATPRDIGRAVVFLASEPYIVGTVLRVDGGYALGDFGQQDDPLRPPQGRAPDLGT